MPIVIIRPNATGDANGCGASPVVDHYLNVREVVQDGDATRVDSESQPAFNTDLYQLEDVSFPVVCVINSVTVYYCCEAWLAPWWGCAAALIRTGGVTYDITGIWNPGFGGGAIAPALIYTLYNVVWALNPNTGLAWTKAQIQALQAGIGLRRTDWTGGGSRTCCTQLYVAVDYSFIIPTAQTNPATEVS